jgi:phosphomannomutase
MIKTTASALSWDEWAKNYGIKVVNVPVGFKEIANIMKKVELQLHENPEAEVKITDVFGEEINLGVQPRLLFGGEESGGMIMGPDELIESLAGRKAIAMREKSATEAIIVASALAAKLEEDNKTLSEYLEEIYEENNIIAKFDVREDISYYNESEADISKLMSAKKAGEVLRTKNDVFYLTLALAIKEGEADLDTVKKVLNKTFPELNFDNLIDVKFVGDGTYLQFTDKFVEIRPSGTDAKTKAYAGGEDLDNLKQYAQVLGNYSGDRNDMYYKLISSIVYDLSKVKAQKYYLSFVNKDADLSKFEIPDYTW